MEQHLRSIERRFGKPPAGLIGPPMPIGMEIYWRCFLELSSQRSFSDMGMPHPLSFADIQAWAAMTRRTVTLRELEVIFALDLLYRSTQTTTRPEDNEYDDLDD